MVQVEQSYQRISHMQWLHPQYIRMENCQIRHLSISVITVCEWQLMKMMMSTYVLLMCSISQESSCKYKCERVFILQIVNSMTRFYFCEGIAFLINSQLQWK
jgi:hypothetical protein